MLIGSSLDKIYMVMDYYDYDLRTCLNNNKNPFSISEIKNLLYQLCDGINHMHNHWFIHRDLKTSNILYSNKKGILCICDFGMARKFGSPIGKNLIFFLILF